MELEALEKVINSWTSQGDKVPMGICEPNLTGEQVMNVSIGIQLCLLREVISVLT